MPAQSELDTKDIIDMYATLSIQKTAVERSLKKLRPTIEKLGEGLHAGNMHALKLVAVTSYDLSVPIAKSLLTPAEIAQATVTSKSLRVTVEH